MVFPDLFGVSVERVSGFKSISQMGPKGRARNEDLLLAVCDHSCIKDDIR